ncbi:thiamine pyrophosphate-binding protein [Xylophilus sp. GOD-11R]|uniref:thiamine pyrophosphate-binding protein n=1 Tax=Xylophilus sp. GOD-11R TaxID=3089814 RepID=UPI00298BFC3D|nr:thiamine pyrophosphate-binding protein [Xylophilus sp. GOD-11R]WPB55290.1 thiamine pyrophosphate-binding protein [Xylophilus sp. GOD-11R]
MSAVIDNAAATAATPVATRRSAGKALVESLQAHGVDRVFCVPGESYLEVLDALHDAPDIHLVVAKHEGGASNMAEADGKLTGRPGICMVTRGPGATHASIGVHTAQQDSTPMILFVGQIARQHKGREAFQEVDYGSMFGTVAKWVVEITEAERVPEILARAFHVAVSGRPGPVVVSLPEDMLTEPCATPVSVAAPVQRNGIAAPTLQRIAEALSTARQPLVVVGGGNWSEEHARHLQAFAHAWQLPVAVSFRRQDALDNRDPHYVGHLSLGMNPKLRQRMLESDLILAIGTRLGDIATDGYALLDIPAPRQKLIHLHVDAGELGRVYQPAIAVQADIGMALADLAALPAPASRSWAESTRTARADHEAFSKAPALSPEFDGVDMTAVVKHLTAEMPSDVVITNGAGNYSVWAHRFHEYREPHTQLAPTCGAMGYGLPAAVAAALRDPGRPVVCFAGDGCFLMYPQELATAAEYGASFLVLLVNNGMYGTIRMHQEKHHPGRISGTRLKGPDYVALAKAFGAHAERVVRTEDFPAALARARANGGLALIELMTDPRQITPGARLAG